MPRAISFDLDDTLWRCDQVIERAERALYEWLRRRAPAITRDYGLEDMRSIRKQSAERNPALGVDLSALRRETLAWHAEQAGYPRDLADEGLAVFLDERNRVEPFADVRPVLERLAQRYPLVAVTNGNADVGRTGLGDLFRDSLSAADVGAAKPDPAMFDAVCRALGVRAGDLMHVGDDPIRDVHAARRFGARTVWVDRYGQAWPETIPRAHHEMRTLHELEALLDGNPGAGPG